MTGIPQGANSASRLQTEKLAIERAMREAINEAVLHHKRLGLSMVVWQGGQVVWIPADQLTVNAPDPTP